jgi:hypothetical protein
VGKLNFKFRTQKRSANIQKIGELVPIILKNFGLEQAITIESIRADWSDIVGDLSAASSPDNIKDGVMYIISKHPTISYEIIMMKTAIIARFNEKYNANLKNIRVLQERKHKEGQL